MSEGQTISVKVAEGDLKVSGNIDIKMLDTQSKVFTQFSFTAYDAKPDTVRPHQAIIDIETTGPMEMRKLVLLELLDKLRRIKLFKAHKESCGLFV